MTDRARAALAEKLDVLLSYPEDPDCDQRLAQDAIGEYVRTPGIPIEDLVIACDVTAMVLAALAGGASRALIMNRLASAIAPKPNSR